MQTVEMRVIARIQSEFHEKFGIPRQSGLVPSLRSKIIFEPEFQHPDALRGIEGFSHLWLIWLFSESIRKEWSPTVRPPRLGGNTRVGVFATRSPFRPNAIGLSCVKLEQILQESDHGKVLIVSGADLMDGTPIFDIKPYLPYADCIPDAAGGFANDAPIEKLTIVDDHSLLQTVSHCKRDALMSVLRLDPRPSYQNDPDRIYGMIFADYNIRFYVLDDQIHIISIEHV